MSEPKLNKRLYTDITRLKLLANKDAQPRFIVDQSPFDDDGGDDEELAAAINGKDIVIVGRIFPDSDVYNQGSFQIEMKLLPKYPYEPPQVRFITKIYHPNIHIDGQFCNELLQKAGRWMFTNTLVEVIKIVVKHVDHPDIEYSASFEMGKKYMENKSEFDREALEYVSQYALPRA